LFDGSRSMKKWDVVLTAILVACALVTTGLVIRREFFAPTTAQASAAEKARYIEDWRSHLSDGVRMGSLHAPIQIIEFADFECPFCAQFHFTLKDVEQKFTGKVAVSFVHFPLPGHRFARPAARAAECAEDQGRFEAMQDQLFSNQDAFGIKDWSDIATAAGVTDLDTFSRCVKQETPVPRIDDGIRAGEELDVRSTPTIIINGWKLGQPPSAAQLERMIQAILDGKKPVG
jgi:protein-disulfide isomerase